MSRLSVSTNQIALLLCKQKKMPLCWYQHKNKNPFCFNSFFFFSEQHHTTTLHNCQLFSFFVFFVFFFFTLHRVLQNTAHARLNKFACVKIVSKKNRCRILSITLLSRVNSLRKQQPIVTAQYTRQLCINCEIRLSVGYEDLYSFLIGLPTNVI